MDKKKLDKTLTKEFRKAMQQVFYSDSDTDKRHKNLIGTNFDDDADDDHIDRTTNKIQSFDGTVIFDESERSISENDALVEDSDEESEKFVGGYLQRLQARSMPQEVKKMLGNHSESSDNLSFSSNEECDVYHSVHRKLKRKKDGELAINDVDPSEIYAQELEKKKGKKVFTVAGLRKEMEDEFKQLRQKQRQEQQQQQNIFDIKPTPLNTKKKLKNNLSGPKNLGQHNKQPGLISQRSFATNTSNQRLLVGSRNNGLIGVHPVTIEKEDDDGDEGEGAFLSRGMNSDDFGIKDSIKDSFNSYKSKIGFNVRLPKVTINKIFTSKKSQNSDSNSGDGDGGLLSVSEDRFGGEKGFNSLKNNHVGVTGDPVGDGFAPQDPLPVPQPQSEQGTNFKNNGFHTGVSVFKAIGKRNSKNILTKFKLPGKKNNKFGGGFMMDDDGEDDDFSGEIGLLGQT